ncbi:MAG TPA: AURKAIP1/COX24 domain-containing protein [Nitrospiraceae bacterium]|nr:AURKAIP1/COX24 domain-containing protein [Nitrospiraceae bacterium]
MGNVVKWRKKKMSKHKHKKLLRKTRHQRSK